MLVTLGTNSQDRNHQMVVWLCSTEKCKLVWASNDESHCLMKINGGKFQEKNYQFCRILHLVRPMWFLDSCDFILRPLEEGQGSGIGDDFGSAITFHLGFVHTLQDVALSQLLPLSCVYCFSCSSWFPPSLLCHRALFYLVVPLISSLSLVATQLHSTETNQVFFWEKISIFPFESVEKKKSFGACSQCLLVSKDFILGIYHAWGTNYVAMCGTAVCMSAFPARCLAEV